MFSEDLLAALRELLEASSVITSGELPMRLSWSGIRMPENGLKDY